MFCRYLEGLLAAEQQESGIPQERVKLFSPPGCSYCMAALHCSCLFYVCLATRHASHSQHVCGPPACKRLSLLAALCADGSDGLLSGWRHGSAQPQVPVKGCGSAGAEQLPGAGRGALACTVAAQRAVLQAHAHCHPHCLNAMAVQQLRHGMQLPSHRQCMKDPWQCSSQAQHCAQCCILASCCAWPSAPGALRGCGRRRRAGS